jgi:hypothetical protein
VYAQQVGKVSFESQAQNNVGIATNQAVVEAIEYMENCQNKKLKDL